MEKCMKAKAKGKGKPKGDEAARPPFTKKK